MNDSEEQNKRTRELVEQELEQAKLDGDFFLVIALGDELNDIIEEELTNNGTEYDHYLLTNTDANNNPIIKERRDHISAQIDRAILKRKTSRATDPLKRKKLQKQLELIDDAIVIYKLKRTKEKPLDY